MVEVYIHTQVWNTWDAHTKLGFYIGTSMEHYRCNKAWISKVRQIHATETMLFKNDYLAMLTITLAHAVLKVAMDLEPQRP